MSARTRIHARSALVAVIGAAVLCAANAFAAGGTQRTYRVGDGAQPRLQAVVTIDATELSIADRATLRIDADAPADNDITLPPFDTTIDGWRLVEVTRAESFSGSPPRKHVSLAVVLEPFLPGDKAIPSLAISARAPGRSAPPAEIKTEPLIVKVIGALETKTAPAAPAPREIRTITMPETVERKVAIGAVVLGGLLGLGILGWAIVAISRRSKVQPDQSAFAIAELARLANQPTPDVHAPGQLPTLVSRHFRTVLGRSLGEPAHDRTLAELRSRVALHAALPENARASVLDLLARLEAASYAPQESLHAAGHELAGTALAIARALHASSGDSR